MTFLGCKCKLEFCAPIAVLTLNEANLAEELFSPQYPEDYNSKQLCGIIITVDVSKPFTITMHSIIDECSKKPYKSFPTRMSPRLDQTDACTTSGNSSTLLTMYEYIGRKTNVRVEKITVFLLEGSHSALSISISGKQLMMNLHRFSFRFAFG